jgi:two-component system response regulator HydG
MRHPWPGNVRELENAVERAVILCRGDAIAPDDLPDTVCSPADGEKETDTALKPGLSLKEMEKQMILRTLEETEGNRTHAAEILGISRRTLQNKLKEYGINP